MKFEDNGCEILEIPKLKENEKQFFSKKTLEKFDQLMGDDEIEKKIFESDEQTGDVSYRDDKNYSPIFKQDNKYEVTEIFETENESKFLFSQKALEKYDRLMGDDQINEKQEGLTDEQKRRIKEETGWSDEIIDAIASIEEYEIYKKAGLVEAEINGKKCLVRSDIDWNQKDAMGRTNKERAEQGLSPVNKDGQVIELHHIGQHADSPLAELTIEEHRGKGNDLILHDKTKESEIDRQAFSTERSNHWEARAKQENDNE